MLKLFIKKKKKVKNFFFLKEIEVEYLISYLATNNFNR